MRASNKSGRLNSTMKYDVLFLDGMQCSVLRLRAIGQMTLRTFLATINGGESRPTRQRLSGVLFQFC